MQKRQWMPGSYSKDTRSIQAVIATETPAAVWDNVRYEVIDEVLLASGAKWPESGQVVFLDSHSRGSVRDILGSVRDLRIEKDSVAATVYFSDDGNGKAVESKFSAGHITDVSVGYIVNQAVWVPLGETQTVNGKSYDGPVKVVTDWTLKEVSAVAIGADQNAKVRSETINSDERKIHTMENQNQNIDVEQIKTEERNRVAEISAMCARADCSHIGQALIERGADLEQARKVVLDFMLKTKADQNFIPVNPRYLDDHFSVGLGDSEKRAEALTDGQLLRAGIRIEKPAPGASDLRGLSLIDLGRECLAMAGAKVRGMDSGRIIRDALSMRAHTTSDYPYILANVANKGLREIYQQAPSTFEKWTTTASIQDFKQVSRVQLGEGPDLLEIPEHSEYKYGTFGESREVYQLITYGRMFAITRQAIVNDDLGSFFRVPRAFAMAAKRLINSTVYGILTANAAMGDGVALFDSSHSNYVGSGSGAAPNIATLTSGRAAMRLQSGIDGAILNIAPKFLIVPAALETSGDALLNTTLGFDSSDGPGVSNSFYKKLELVVDPVLDATSEKGWYLACDSAMFDTVEVGYLGGNQFPTLESQAGWSVDGIEYKCRIDFGAKALDHRGLYWNYGS
jgi:hypothetical protein